ncbi:hypothetical protein BCON_0343g00020 [Botryotinia convoluta]|uniref:Uncharacterized protein n=1 Tax=Botryotinia convoluta TaxID=54673 RepID=A0A4Z1HAE9_9HELO|nr:hypothetical protein BCON_0343g00020 [Botryotinia convoluta]
MSFDMPVTVDLELYYEEEEEREEKKREEKKREEKKRKYLVDKLDTLDTSALTKTEGAYLVPRHQSQNIKTSKRSPKF